MVKARAKTVGLTYDVRSDYIPKPGDPPDINAEFDKPMTIDCIEAAIRSGGHTVKRIGNVHKLLDEIDSLDVDIVFNICEGMGTRNRESQVPMLLELKGIPYVGSDALTLGVALDKIVAKKIFIAHSIPTPKYIEIKNPYNLNGLNLNFPLILKLKHEGTSKGLTDNSVVKDREELIRQSKSIIDAYRQPAIAEEFIEGKEFTVGIIGNDNPKTLPPVQVEIRGRLDLGNLFYTSELVKSDDVRYLCPAVVSKEEEKKLQELALETYMACECRDFGRVDFRMNRHGEPYVLEINPLPSLSPEDIFYTVGNYLGVGYNRMILDILDAAFERCGI